jgi:membrane protein DedA with SNARE-associated domain
LNEILEFFKNIDKIYVYLWLFIFCYFENIFPPLPGDTVVVIGAYLVGIGFLRFDFTYLSVNLGSIFGFMTMYYLGVFFRNRILNKRNDKSQFYTKIEKVQQWFGKYGYKIILFNRFLSGLRAVVALTAGISNLNLKKVFVLALISIVLWNGILIYLGYLLGEKWGILIKYIKEYNFIILVVLVLIFTFYFIIKRYRSK